MASIQSTIQLVDRITSPVNNMISALNNLCGAYEDVDNEMQSGFDRSRIDSARAAIAQAAQQVDALGRSLHGIEMPDVPFEWQSFDGLEVFTNTGAERFQQEITSVNAMLDRLGAEQDGISRRANEMEILDPRAQYDIELVENRLHSLQQMIEQAADNAVSIGVDGADNANMERLRAQLTQTLSLQEQLNSAMQSGDLSGINNAYLQMSQNISNLERSVRDSFSQPIEVPIVWNSGDNVEVFSGADRYAQEIADVTARMQRLSDAQNQITQNAANSNVFSPAAVSDMTAINQRISAIQARITQINSNRANALNPNAAAEAENLRRQLASMLQTQEQLNSAVDNMDVEAANRAYLQLSSSVNNTERYIRDNVDEQERFNHSIRNGASSADELMNKIGGFVGAFASVATVKKAMDLSDELVSTTARIDLMNQAFNKTNNTVIETDSLVSAVYQSAQDARGSFSDMAAVVAKFGNNARDAFSSQQEVIDFATLVQKQMTIAGASTTEASNAMLQLSQALGSGTLRGDELNSIFEQAPNLIQSIAEYLHQPIGSIRDMASEGEITADIVKNAIFEASDNINAQFEEMPMTWGQVWTSMQNTALMKFQPILNKISEIAQMEEVQQGITAAMDMLAVLAEFTVEVLGAIASAAAFVSDNWDVLAPIFLAAATALGVYSVALAVHKAAVNAAALAQQGFNIAVAAKSALGAAAGVLVFVGAIGLYTKGVNDAYGTTFSFAGMLGGALMTVLATLGNLVIGIANRFIMAFDFIWNAVAAFINFFANVWENPIGAVWNLWKDLFTNVTDILLNITELIDTLFKTNFSDKLEGFRNDMISRVESTYGEEMKKANVTVMDKRNDRLEYINLDEAFEVGYYLGEELTNKSTAPATAANAQQDILDSIYQSVEGVLETTSDIKDGIELTGEDLKYLRDVAERDVVNRFTTSEINVNLGGVTNNVNSEMDLDGVVDYLATNLQEAIETTAEGVHI